MDWYIIVLIGNIGLVLVSVAGAGIAVAALRITKTSEVDQPGSAEKKAVDGLNWIIEFYLSLIAYFILHMIFVISSDFVDAFNIPPLNIGIYVDKLAAIRALLMVFADILEYGVLDQACQDHGKMQMPLYGDDTNKKLNWGGYPGSAGGQSEWDPQNPRRLGSILSFLAMLICRIVYLYLIYKSDNKSLYVFIVLCIEGFWFGVFQMSFFAIGPQYNAATSLGIHTMGNFIFFGQLIMQRQAKTQPYINSLYRVRVHAKTCLITSVSAFIAWIGFCIGARGDSGIGTLYTQLNASDSGKTQSVERQHAMSPLLLFIVGAFAEDFSVPGILPFALLDNDKSALVNYLTPAFFMTGAFITFLANDMFGGTAGAAKGPNCYFKEWSANFGQGVYWHALWLLNIPKYMAFFIAMWCIHGTYPSLRCIVQSRWRVMLLTMTVVVPRAFLETAGYVGVANWALARAAVMKNQTNGGGRQKEGDWKPAQADFSGFVMIMVHDLLAMFCRFVYGKFAVGYNLAIVSC